MITTITITVSMKLTGLRMAPWRSRDPLGSVDDNSDNDNSGDEGCITTIMVVMKASLHWGYRFDETPWKITKVMASTKPTELLMMLWRSCGPGGYVDVNNDNDNSGDEDPLTMKTHEALDEIIAIWWPLCR